MNHSEIYQAFQAVCCLASREVQPTINMPAELKPAAHLKITDPTLFVTTTLSRLESASPLLRGLAEKALRAFIKSQAS